ncbi:MAG: L,D-transpeptidase [Sphingobium sp.]
MSIAREHTPRVPANDDALPNTDGAIIRVDTATRTLYFGDHTLPCAIGKGGACPAEDKREGDGRTPLGRWPIRGVLLRPGRLSCERPPLIPWRWTRPDDGWSDGVDDPAYNRPVTLPRAFSHERLQRDDAAYDIIIILGHNDTPPIPGKGSAIFWHLWVPDENGTPKPTEGCIAVAREAMERILPDLRPGMVLEIS